MRTEKKVPYVLIEHKKDLLGTSYTDWIRGLLSGLTTNWHELDYKIAASKPLQAELLAEIPLEESSANNQKKKKNVCYFVSNSLKSQHGSPWVESGPKMQWTNLSRENMRIIYICGTAMAGQIPLYTDWAAFTEKGIVSNCPKNRVRWGHSDKYMWVWGVSALCHCSTQTAEHTVALERGRMHLCVHIITKGRNSHVWKQMHNLSCIPSYCNRIN